MSKTTAPAAPLQSREYFEQQHSLQVAGLKTLHTSLAADIDTLTARNTQLSDHAGKYGISLSGLTTKTPVAITPGSAPKRGRKSIPFLAEVRKYVNENKTGFTMTALVKTLIKNGATKDDTQNILMAARYLEEHEEIKTTRRTDETGTTLYVAVS